MSKRDVSQDKVTVELTMQQLGTINSALAALDLQLTRADLKKKVNDTLTVTEAAFFDHLAEVTKA